MSPMERLGYITLYAPTLNSLQQQLVTETCPTADVTRCHYEIELQDDHTRFDDVEAFLTLPEWAKAQFRAQTARKRYAVGVVSEVPHTPSTQPTVLHCSMRSRAGATRRQQQHQLDRAIVKHNRSAKKYVSLDQLKVMMEELDQHEHDSEQRVQDVDTEDTEIPTEKLCARAGGIPTPGGTSSASCPHPSVSPPSSRPHVSPPEVIPRVSMEFIGVVPGPPQPLQ